jgi:hypothetical protein
MMKRLLLALILLAASASPAAAHQTASGETLVAESPGVAGQAFVIGGYYFTRTIYLDFGDGSPVVTFEPQAPTGWFSVEHVYAAPGLYFVEAAYRRNGSHPVAETRALIL